MEGCDQVVKGRRGARVRGARDAGLRARKASESGVGGAGPGRDEAGWSKGREPLQVVRVVAGT